MIEWYGYILPFFKNKREVYTYKNRKKVYNYGNNRSAKEIWKEKSKVI